MPALNRTYLIESAGDIVCMFSNTANVADVVNASLTPVGTPKVNEYAKYYAEVNKSTTFMIFVPQGYTLGDIFTYNNVSDTWQKMNWRQIQYGDSFYKELCYYTDTNFDEPLINGYTGYVYAEHDADGDLVMRTFPISFTVEKNNN